MWKLRAQQNHATHKPQPFWKFINRSFVTLKKFDHDPDPLLKRVTFLGLVLALRARTNIRVDLIDGMLPARLLAARDIVSDVAAIAIFGVIQWKVWRLVEVGSGQVIMGTPFSSDVTFLALAVSSAAAIIILAVRLVLRFSGRDAPRVVDGTGPEDQAC